jgi:uncharacterized protein (TIGR02246 family)
MATGNQVVTRPDEEAQIRKLVDEWREAIRTRDPGRLEKLYAADVVYFDVVPPYEQRGWKAYRASWEGMFQHLPPHVTPETRDLEIAVSGDLAVMHGFTRIVNDDTGKNAAIGWVRVTVVYQRTGREWKVIHEHVSVPIDAMTGKAEFIKEL